MLMQVYRHNRIDRSVSDLFMPKSFDFREGAMNKKDAAKAAIGFPLGICIGIIFGALIHNMAIGIIIGFALGFGVVKFGRRKP